MNNEEIVDGDFEEISDREVILTSELSDKDQVNIANSETTEVSPEDAAAFAAELAIAKEDFAAATGTGDERPLTQAEMIKAVTAAAKDGVISGSKKSKFLREMGIFQSEFTKKKISKSTKVNKRKAAKKARRKNRK